MPPPNFSKAQTYVNCYVDSTQYTGSPAGSVPISYTWQFAPMSSPTLYGQLPNPLNNDRGSMMRFTVIADGTQGATLQVIQVAIAAWGGGFTPILWPTSAFAASAPFTMKVVAELGILATGDMYCNMTGFVDQTGGAPPGLVATNSNVALITAANMPTGGPINISVGFGAAGPTFISRYNYLEIANYQ